MDRAAIDRLCAGIVRQAINDYMMCLKSKNGNASGFSRDGLETYFHSETYRMICSLDGDWVIKICKQKVNHGRRKKI